jgi:peptide deformylase
MSIKQTVQIGNEIIRQKVVRVKDVSADEIQQTIKDLIDSMRHNNLVGMAAPQIGKNLQIFVSEVRKTTYRKNIARSDSLKVFINPAITWQSKRKISGYEGCGSVAGAQLFGSVERSESIICKALDENGKPFKIKSSGFLARIIQHETDHLNGIVFLDRISDTKTLMDKQIYIDSQKK